MSNDFGFTDAIEFVEPAKGNKPLADELDGLIIPFLRKLAENPDKDIHWPNRADAIDLQIIKIREKLRQLW